MEYLTFVEELKKHILKNEKWNISEENYKFYPDGYLVILHLYYMYCFMTMRKWD